MMNKEAHPVSGLMDVTLQKIKEMADGNAVIGNPIHAADGTMVLPVSKVSYGFASGGSDVGSKATKDMFGGGSGAGVSVVPVAFLVLRPSGEVRLLQVNSTPNTLDKALDMLPDVLEKIAAFLAEKTTEKGQKTKEEES